MVGSEVAHRVGRGRVAGEREGLAAAAAEIQLAARAARARLLHPGGAAEGIEGRRVRPDVGERMLAHVPEFEPGNRFRGVAGQHLAGGRDVERAPAPAADARLRIARVIVRHHRVDDDAAVMARAQILHRRRRALDLLAGRHQRGAVLERPAVILHVRDLDAACAERQCEIDHLADAVDVGAMHDRVDGQRQPVPHDLGRERALARERAVIAGDVVGGGGLAVLDGDLHVVEPGCGERAQRPLGDADRRR